MMFTKNTLHRSVLHVLRPARPRTLLAAIALVLLVPTGLAPVTDAHASEAGLSLPEQRVSKVHPVRGLGADKARSRLAKNRAANRRQTKRAAADRRSTWPSKGSATYTGAAKQHLSPGGLPLTVSRAAQHGAHSSQTREASSAAQIKVYGHEAARKARVLGVLFSADATGGDRLRLDIDYSSFASAVGGGWSARLHLVSLPGCAVTTPQRPKCRRQKLLPSHNDISQQSLTADLDLPADAPKTFQSDGAHNSSTTTARVFALTATAATGESPSGTGDYSATPFAPAASWKAGNSSGSFTWSHDFTTPPAAAGPQPALTLSYDSGGIDGRTATTNNQGSMVGEGFRLTESYITRAYGSCDEDGHDGVHDQCWKYDNAQLVLNGHATRLVKDDDTGEWHLANDDASRVTHATGADNSDNDGEYWTIVRSDGTKYVFGKDKLSGASSERTNSVWTTPVFGDDTGEPGYSQDDTFSGRSETQAWRWNLDYVEDTHGSVMTYWYQKETNHYKKNNAATANASYTRGGYLAKIMYGQRADALFTDDADAKVTFSYTERCTGADCSDLNEDTAKNWPDVPFDAICADGATDCNASGPSFFTRKRLTGIDTYSWSASSSTYNPVDSWTLKQHYLDPGDIGDSSDQVLVLDSLQRTGKTDTDDISLDPISFSYQLRSNRVDATDDILPLTRPRISKIISETGAITQVTLSDPECTRSAVIDAPQATNSRNCYPQYWHVNGASESSVDWFHKYRVLAVVTSDPTGHNLAVEHSYTYSGAAWHYNDDPMLKKSDRTWSQWRGYREVTSFSGAVEPRSKTVSLYLQGMDGDEQSDGTTRNIWLAPIAVSGLTIPSIEDNDAYAGHLREKVTYDGQTPLTVTVRTPWSKQTAQQTVSGAKGLTARYVRTAENTTHAHLTATHTWRTHRITTSFDDYGMPETVDDSGQLGKSGDQTCIRTWYARNDDLGLTNLVSRTRTVGQSCSVTESELDLPADTGNRDDVLSDTAIVYDDTTATDWQPDQMPTTGDATWTGRATGYPSTATGGERNPTGWQATATTTYDDLGRPLSVSDAEGNPTTTAYTPTDSGPLTRTITTNPSGHKTYAYLDPRRGQPLRIYDPNLHKTETSYDALGRLTAVWKPNRISGSDTANTTYAYHLSNSEPSWVSTSTLKPAGDS
jgi:YD repeat-containing protein